MRHNALTDLKIKNLKPKKVRYKVRDGGGLALEVMPSGSKFWRVLKVVDGVQKVHTLGKYPDVPLSEARRQAEEVRAAMLAGDGGRKKDVTFGELARDWMEHPTKELTKTYTETLRGRLKRYLLPALGNVPVNKITARQLFELLRAIAGPDGHKAETARRVKQVYSQIALYGVAVGLCESDVSAGLSRVLPPAKHKHMAAITSDEDIKRLLLAMSDYRGSSITTAALWFSLYTLARPGEIRQAEWCEIDLEAATWTIGVEKMKMRRPHTIPLCSQALELLKNLHMLTGCSRYLFPCSGNKERPMSENTVRMALRRMGFTAVEMTAHGVRSLGSTKLNELGYRSDLIEAALAHTIPGVRGVYCRADYLEERRVMMQGWADWLERL